MSQWMPLRPGKSEVAIPENLLGSLDSLLMTLDDVRATLAESPRIVAVPPVTAVAINGDRGTGKTTLLSAACAALADRADDYLVLPAMRPELFGSRDTVLSSFLASLQRSLSAGQQQVSVETLTAIARAARTYAMSRTPERALETSASPVDYAEDALSVARSSVALSDELHALMSEVVKPPDAPVRLVIVPIDDPDLAPELITTILADIRTLASIPGVVPVACFSMADLQLELLAKRRQRYDWLPAGTLSRQIEKELDKVFPYKYRFDLRPLSVYERAAFRPAGERDSLAALLQDFSDALGQLTGSQLHFEQWLRAPRYMRGLTSPLPNNPRSLVQLWETLSPGARIAGSRTQVALTLMQRIIRLVERPLLDDLGALLATDRETVELVEEATSGGEDSLLQAHLTTRAAVSLIVARQRPLEQAGAPATSVQMARLTGIYADVRVDDRDRTRLAQEALSAFLALQELALAVTPRRDQPYLSYLGEDDWRFLQTTRLAGQSASSSFFLAPPGFTFSDICLLADLWNSMVDLQIDAADIDTIARAHLALGMAFRRGLNRLSRSSFDKQRYDELYEMASRQYRDAVDSSASRDDAYCVWFENFVPLHWHTAFVSEQLAVMRARRHRATLGAASDMRAASIRSGDQQLEFFDRAIRPALDPDRGAAPTWLGGLYPVARELGSRYADRLAAVWPEWQRLLVTDQAAEAVVFPLTVESNPSSRNRFAKEESERGRALLERGLEVLRQLSAGE
ncbi:hypothetical protein GCM10027451_03540 [Geodermatophilus aquaeductus]|uniref:KAP NTPase domain-containing protein n=1 Tax=Geodermatophilus aquaeductus TaxID=1564161 RepID=A0A521CDP5_9ACTN|nr:P-loop NTPase fold protein [Geodermatophilus aquaeductus]SMO57557.1 hypothetical protein SAMN06273567_102323 [Geodermatophilus aquaeductus]